VAKVAKKTWPWPGLPGFTRPHFPGKLGKKPGKPALARLCQAGRVFDRAPDARELLITACSVVDKIYLYLLSLILIQQNIQSDKTDEPSHPILNITSFGNAKDKIQSQFSSRRVAR